MAKYDIEVKLVGEDGNAFAILGNVSREMKRNNIPKKEVDEFLAEATNGNYDNLLCVCSEWVNVV